MTDRIAWTPETITAYAALHGLVLPSPEFGARLRQMAQKASDVAATLKHDFDREDQPAFAFMPGESP